MMFKPNPSQFASVFVLPTSIADAHLKLCSAAQLKVILACYRLQNDNADIGMLCEKTGLSEGEVLDACAYWAECGVLLCDGEVPKKSAAAASVASTVADVRTQPAVQHTAQNSEANSVPGIGLQHMAQQPTPAAVHEQEPVRSVREKITVTPTRPTYEQIRHRLDESAQVRELFNEVQVTLGRLLGTGDQAALLLLHDYYGLKTEILLMLCEYARSVGKAGNLNYIYAVGTDWSSREIDTFERAVDEIRRLQTVNTSWSQLCKLTGLQHPNPTKSQQKYLACWLDEWHFSLSMVALAYEKMKERTDSVRFSYLNGILKKWYEKGITTPEQAAEEEKQFREQAAAPKKAAPAKPNANTRSGIPDTPASYDLEKAEKQARESVPTLRKRKR